MHTEQACKKTKGQSWIKMNSLQQVCVNPKKVNIGWSAGLKVLYCN